MSGQGIYVASKVAHAIRWQHFRTAGFPIVSTWIDEAGVGESKDLTDLWDRCISEASGAAALVLYREDPEVLKGAWVELGAALANSVPVFAVGIEGFTVGRHRGVRHCVTAKEAFTEALRYAPKLRLAEDDRAGWQKDMLP